MSPQLKTIRIIKSTGASAQVIAPYLSSSHQQYVPFKIKTAWRPKSKKTGLSYDNFINLT
jgi:hypothetical protein